MSFLYLTEKATKISASDGTMVVDVKDCNPVSLPIATIEGIVANKGVSFTSNILIEILERGIPLLFTSERGNLYGKLQSTANVNIDRQRLQFRLGDSLSFCCGLAKKILEAKVNNQIVLVRRYSRTRETSKTENSLRLMTAMQDKIKTADSIQEARGYEGMAAKAYFEALNEFVTPEFSFSGRNRKPPKDPFNAMISYGYTLLMYEIYDAIEMRGLSPYAGFIHQDRQGHPALVSDLIEEWRAPIVDSLVLNMISRHEVNTDHFSANFDTSGIYLNYEGNKVFLKQFENKLSAEVNYFETAKVSFRRGIDIQVMQLVRAIEAQNYMMYEPLRIR